MTLFWFAWAFFKPKKETYEGGFQKIKKNSSVMMPTRIGNGNHTSKILETIL